MKKFETPELEILEFSVVDVIATSTEEPTPFENDGIWA